RPREEGPSGEIFTTRFEARAARTPDAPAWIGDDRTTSCGDLEKLSAEIARKLAERLKGAAAPIAIDLAMSPALLAARLAAWRTGCPFVSLDPSYPEAYSERLVRQAKPGAIIRSTRGPTLASWADHMVHLDEIDRPTIPEGASSRRAGQRSERPPE